MVAVSVIGAPSTSHSTAGCGPCHRTARDSREPGARNQAVGLQVDASPRWRDAAGKHRGSGEQPTLDGRDHGHVGGAPRRCRRAKRRVRPRTVPQAGEVAKRPVFAGGCQYDGGGVERSVEEVIAATGRGGDSCGNIWHRGDHILAVQITEADEFANAEQMTFRLGVRIGHTGEQQLTAGRS